jgi:hypothetical protein
MRRVGFLIVQREEGAFNQKNSALFPVTGNDGTLF